MKVGSSDQAMKYERGDRWTDNYIEKEIKREITIIVHIHQTNKNGELATYRVVSQPDLFVVRVHLHSQFEVCLHPYQLHTYQPALLEKCVKFA